MSWARPSVAAAHVQTPANSAHAKSITFDIESMMSGVFKNIVLVVTASQLSQTRQPCLECFLFDFEGGGRMLFLHSKRVTRMYSLYGKGRSVPFIILCKRMDLSPCPDSRFMLYDLPSSTIHMMNHILVYLTDHSPASFSSPYLTKLRMGHSSLPEGAHKSGSPHLLT